ncbi:TetR family transcriptional regulator [Mycolicibacterium tusciae]|uniref:TetR family transcriptional regulator n=1 Tax=Mycolicibacterium tusciae TaxID=75922 RepID=UPI00024A1F44|nr:TetR family transcriptional regulator [Mycolicibacterium tusciae]
MVDNASHVTPCHHSEYLRCMPRWEHGSKERLQQAAIELFEEQGFEDTSAVQIAKRARVTTRTFFRYFSDKQEVLFADEEMLHAALVQEIRQTADISEPLQTVTRILAAYDWEGLASRESLRRREAMIASTPYLRERELNKQHQMADEFSNALHARGVDPEIAALAADVGIQVFRSAYRQWLAVDKKTDLATMTDTVMTLLTSIVPAKATATRKKASAAQRKKPDSTPQRRRPARPRGSSGQRAKQH